MASYNNQIGAIFGGGSAAMILSGVSSTQAFMYFRNYPEDRLRIKTMVAIVWILDLVHTGFVFGTGWIYLVKNWGEPDAIGNIAWTVIVMISLTGTVTFVVHCFFIHRIWTLSKYRWWIPAPALFLAFLRMLSAYGVVMILQIENLTTWQEYHAEAAWSFTTGLALSAVVDWVIAFAICYFLGKSRTGFSSMDHVIDSIIRWSIESGMLTSIITSLCLILWLKMPNSFIFLALYFVISKLYTNSFLATLNARRVLKERSQHSAEQYNSFPPQTFLSDSSRNRQHFMSHFGVKRDMATDASPDHPLQVNISKTVHSVADDLPAEVGGKDLEQQESEHTQ